MFISEDRFDVQQLHTSSWKKKTIRMTMKNYICTFLRVFFFYQQLQMQTCELLTENATIDFGKYLLDVHSILSIYLEKYHKNYLT